MTSSSEIILPIGTQKHDPAWGHCLLIQANDRTQLKCRYCSKLFLGGGIHRIKEHLARHKGNAAGCTQVPEDVQNIMRRSLEAVDARRKKKIKLADQVSSHTSANEGENGIQMIALPEVLDSGITQAGEEGVASVTKTVRRKRTRSSRPPPASIPEAYLPGNHNPLPAKGKEDAYMAIGQFLIEAGVPLDAVNSVYFRQMIDAVSSVGPGLEPPSFFDLDGWVLKKSIEEVNVTLEHYRESWARTGCSVLADEWMTDMGQTMINFLVYCPEGTMFLRSVDATQIVTSNEVLYELLKQVVEEVGVQNVVQVITNNTECHAQAGKWLQRDFPSIFWMPCTSRCIDALLGDLGKLEPITDIIEEAKSIIGFICNQGEALNMIRRYTDWKDTVLPSETCSGVNFITLRRIIDLKDALIGMVTSQEGMDCLTKTREGAVVAELICSPSFWSSCDMVVRLAEPLVRVSRITGSCRRPAMGYFLAAIYHVKESIKKELIERNAYMPYWEIIDRAWDGQLPLPLHAAGFFLNPQCFYSIPEIPKEISSGMLKCIERLVPDVKVQEKINKELSLYKNAVGDFGRKMAVRARNTLLPADWWSTYGGGCPNLTRLAVRILNQTCSATVCEKNNIPFERLHYQRMNYSEHQQFRDLAFVQYNLRLQQRKVVKPFNSVSAGNNDVTNCGVDKNDIVFEDDEDFCWMSNEVLSGYTNYENVETSFAEHDDEMVHGTGLDSEDDAQCTVEDGSHDDLLETNQQDCLRTKIRGSGTSF